MALARLVTEIWGSINTAGRRVEGRPKEGSKEGSKEGRGKDRSEEGRSKEGSKERRRKG